MPDVVVVGAATRDIAADDPRGWRLGGGVSYTALTIARLGLRTVALIGLDADAAQANELDLLRDAGVELHAAPLEQGPVFDNIERSDGRLQIAHHASDPLPVTSLPSEWQTPRGWLLVPVAGELPEGWADVPDDAALVGVGWQGFLRQLQAGQPVRHVAPAPNPIIERADVVGLSRDDVDGDLELADLYSLLRPGATLALTQGARGGVVADGVDGHHLRLRHYPAIPSRAIVDPTGAGDVFLAALVAARVEPRLVGGRIGQGIDLLLAAAAASLVLEGSGLDGVPDRDAVRRRMAEGATLAGLRDD
jgi:sugar/nucleoside kinase (ribokinase family)